MDTNLHSPTLFTPSGCLSEQGLEAYVSHALSSPQLKEVDKHLQQCALCRDAVEGYLLNPVAVPDFSAMIDRKTNTTHPSDRHTNRRMNRITTMLAIAATILLFLGIYWIIIDQIPQQKREIAAMTDLAPDLTPGLDSNLPIKPDSVPVAKNNTRIPDPVMFMVPEVVMDSVVPSEDQQRVEVVSDEDSGPALPEKKVTEQAVVAKEIKGTAGAVRTPAAEKRKAAGKEKLEEEEAIFSIVEEMPSYPDGEQARLQFLKENIVYPQVAKESGIQGTVYLSFIIDENGKINDITVMRGIGGGCDEEAIRVLKKMPRWKPATQAGKPVSVKYTMPVNFKLN